MISKEQIEHVAKLARIELTEKEQEKYSHDLSSILDYIDKLGKVDTKDVKAIQQITGLETVTRKDATGNKKPASPAGRQETRNKILEQAPEKKGNYYKVPKILE